MYTRHSESQVSPSGGLQMADKGIAPPTGVHYNHCLSPGVRPLVKMFITLESY